MLTEAHVAVVLGADREPLFSPSRRFELAMFTVPCGLRTIHWVIDPATGERRIWDVHEWTSHDVLPTAREARALFSEQPVERQQALLLGWRQRLLCILARWDDLGELPNFKLAGKQLFRTERGLPILRLMSRPKLTTSTAFFVAMCQERVPMPRAAG